MTRRLPAALGAVLVALAAPAAPAVADQHVAAVQGELAAMYERLGAIVGNADATPDQKRALVAEEIDRRLDYGYLAAAALGDRIQSFTHQQFADFAQAYARFLQDFFVGTVATAQTSALEILNTREDSAGSVIVQVKSKPRPGVIPGSLRVGRTPTRANSVSYLFRNSRGTWRIGGVSFGGVDVSTTFRGQLEAYLAQNDPDALIAELRRRNADYAGTNPFAP